MITRDSFLEDFGGHGNSYSSFMVLNTTIDEVVAVLNSIDETMNVGSGWEHDGHVGFEVNGALPSLIYAITAKLHTIGYADTDWDVTYTVCARDGEDFDDYTAEWDDGLHYLRDDGFDEEELWDAFVLITDHETGAVFYTGAGAVDGDIERYYADMVKKHPEIEKER